MMLMKNFSSIRKRHIRSAESAEPEEVAELIFYLASENASWITGATYEIDGGRAQTCAR